MKFIYHFDKDIFAEKITGLAVTPSGDACVSCSIDGSVRLYKVPFAPLEAGPVEREATAILEFQGKFGFRSLDHHWRDNIFATVGERVSHTWQPTEIRIWHRKRQNLNLSAIALQDYRSTNASRAQIFWPKCYSHIISKIYSGLCFFNDYVMHAKKRCQNPGEVSVWVQLSL